MLRILYRALSFIIIISYWTVLILMHYDHRVHWPDTIGSKTIQPNELIDLIKQIRPILNEISQSKNFRYFRVDIDRPCVLTDQEICTSKKKCELKCECKKEELPQRWLQDDDVLKQISKNQVLDFLSPETLRKLEQPKGWGFDIITDKTRYVDLTKDREEYTGYQGQNIWKYLYNNHCQQSFDVCQDNKFLYKMISGMHTSVSTHLSNFYIDFEVNKIYQNIEIYQQKVGLHQERLKNLLFANLILLRAFNRYYPQVEHFAVDSENFYDDVYVKTLLDKLTKELEMILDVPFDENMIFGSIYKQKSQRKTFVAYFSEINDLLDCVDCKKCRVYGKLQILGMGVALRILMEKSGDISRNEFIAFINTMNKWTQSIEIGLDIEQKMLKIRDDKIVYWSCLVLVLQIIITWIIKIKFNQFFKQTKFIIQLLIKLSIKIYYEEMLNTIQPYQQKIVFQFLILIQSHQKIQRILILNFQFLSQKLFQITI